MREILFRGKAINRNENYSYRTDYKNGDWVYGLLADVNDYAGFSKMTNTDGVTGIEVDKNTVEQYIGLTDKNGTKIFEGDIVAFGDKSGIVNYGFGCFCIRFNETDYSNRNNPAIDIIFNQYPNVEVIGNIHDNPELLEVAG